jgi:hypothetical protein
MRCFAGAGSVDPDERVNDYISVRQYSAKSHPIIIPPEVRSRASLLQPLRFDLLHIID